VSSYRFRVAPVAATLVLGTLALVAASQAGPSGAQQGNMLNCPQADKWAISVWDGLSGTEAADALATCGADAVDGAYSLDRQTQVWSRWFPGHPELSNLASLNDRQGLLALGGAGAAAGAGSLAAAPAANQMQNCPPPEKWSIAVWDGPSGTAPADAMATCGVVAVAIAYSIDPQTQEWYGNLPPLDALEGLLALGAAAPPGTPTPLPGGSTPAPASPTVTATSTATPTATPTATSTATPTPIWTLEIEGSGMLEEDYGLVSTTFTVSLSKTRIQLQEGDGRLEGSVTANPDYGFGCELPFTCSLVSSSPSDVHVTATGLNPLIFEVSAEGHFVGEICLPDVACQTGEWAGVFMTVSQCSLPAQDGASVSCPIAQPEGATGSVTLTLRKG